MPFDHGGGLRVLRHEVCNALDVGEAAFLDYRLVEVELHIQLDPHRFCDWLGHDRLLGHHLLDHHHFFGAMHPAIGCRHAGTDQCATTRPGRTLNRAQCCATHTADSSTSWPIAFLQAGAARQEAGRQNQGYSFPYDAHMHISSRNRTKTDTYGLKTAVLESARHDMHAR
ncbi:hypothetical protein D3C86_1570630 [compost metagenome]